MESEVITKQSEQAIVASAPAGDECRELTPRQMASAVIMRGGDLSMVTTLMDLQDRHDAKHARLAFLDAMVRFKATAPRIAKDKHVQFETSRGVTQYDHATLGAVCDAVIVGLAAVGISHKWVPEQNGKTMRVTCVLTHVAGHSESTTLEAGADESGGKNSIQAVISAKTYLERHTLLSATGLTTHDADDDGAGSGKRKPEDSAAVAAAAHPVISAEQVVEINAAIIDACADRAAFLRYLRVDKIESLSPDKFKPAMQALAAKARE